APAPEKGDGEENLRGTLATQLRRRQDWNREAFKRRVMGNMEIVHKITELYLQSAPQLIDRILASVAEENYRDLRSAAHELSGMSENLGAEKMALVAKEIQLAALDRRDDDLHYLLSELRDQYARLEDVTKG
ncbi:MAG: Hpt domain-containing protein, partial [Halieaceae bacterium]|nr:Hpt domain-containing protein [Halieaceae bacterium]